jgi:hypothetical protein
VVPLVVGGNTSVFFFTSRVRLHVVLAFIHTLRSHTAQAKASRGCVAAGARTPSAQRSTKNASSEQHATVRAAERQPPHSCTCTLLVHITIRHTCGGGTRPTLANAGRA